MSWNRVAEHMRSTSFGLDWRTPRYGRPESVIDGSYALRNGVEAARIRWELRADSPGLYRTWKSEQGWLQVVLFEVSVDLRGRGIGKVSIDEFTSQFESIPAAAISKGPPSDAFWKKLGWKSVEHQHPFHERNGPKMFVRIPLGAEFGPQGSNYSS